MAGRGRGFRINFGFDSERREIGQTTTTNQPNPLFPVMEQKPLPLVTGETVDYLLALKQELRGAARCLNTFITPEVKKRDVQRYSDKYHQEPDPEQDFNPDWSMFPHELRIRHKRRPEGLKAKLPLGQTGKKVQKSKPEEKTKKTEKNDKTDLLQKLETLEQKEKVRETEEEEEEEEEEKKAEEEEAEEEQLDEDEFEEETDYIMSYFDNGEDFGADSDDNMDEAIY